MPRFRKQPVEIEAVRFTGDNWPEIATFVGEDEEQVEVVENGEGNGPPTLVIHTLEGDMRADPGDWVIRGTKRELYPCKPDVFEEIYLPVEDDE